MDHSVERRARQGRDFRQICPSVVALAGGHRVTFFCECDIPSLVRRAGCQQLKFGVLCIYYQIHNSDDARTAAAQALRRSSAPETEVSEWL